MRLAFCLFKYFPFGGLERDFLKIAQACQRRGHTIDVYCMSWQGEKPQNFNIIILPKTGLTNHQRCANFVKQLLPHLKEKHYAAVIGFNRIPGLDIYYAADSCYQATAFKKHSCWYRLTARYRIYSQLEKAVFSQHASTEILLLIENEKLNFINYYQTPESRFHLLPPGIDKNHVLTNKNIHIRQEFAVSEKQQVILMIGSDFKRKGVDRALQAIAALPANIRDTIKLFVIGQDNAAPYKKLARKLKILNNVIFLGARNDIANFLQIANIFLHPAYQETAGNVLLEAIVAGVPILTTANCGYAFHIEKAQAGLVVPMPFQQETLNDYLKKILDKNQQEIFRENALHYAHHEDLYSLPERAADIIEQVGFKKSALSS